MRKQQRNLGTHAVEDAVEIGVDHAVPFGEWLVGQSQASAADAGVVHCQVERSEVVADLVGDPLHGVRVTHVHAPVAGQVLVRGEGAAGGVRRGPIDVKDRHPRSALQQQPRHRQPDVRGRACDQRHLALELRRLSNHRLTAACA